MFAVSTIKERVAVYPHHYDYITDRTATCASSATILGIRASVGASTIADIIAPFGSNLLTV